MKGYFRKRNDKWSFSIEIGKDPITGKRKQKTVSGFKTKKAAQEAAVQMHSELSLGTYMKEADISFKAFADQWLEIYSETNEVKPGTIRVRNHEIGKWLFYFNKIPIKDISRSMYQDALNDLKEKGYADNTLDGVNRTGKMIFRKAIELEVIKKDPSEFAYLKKTKKTVEELEEEELPKYLEKQDLALFLETANKKGLDQDDLIFHVLAYSGMRIGELVALKWKDIDFKKRTISISKTYYNPKNNTKNYQLVTPKTRKSKRKIVIDDFIIAMLRAHQSDQNELRMLYRGNYHDEGFIFINSDKFPGYPIVIKRAEQRMRRLLILAGLNQELTPHSLRHTHTSLLAEAGVNLETIMERLGHSDDQTTKNVYLHVTEFSKEEASHKFSELMRSLK